MIGALGSDDDSELPAAAIERLMMMGLARDADIKLCLTVEGERAYLALESGENFPGLK
jgi:hypothetical protein